LPEGHEHVNRSPPAIQIPPNPLLRKGGSGDFHAKSVALQSLLTNHQGHEENNSLQDQPYPSS
jgi:hypothetical protein